MKSERDVAYEEAVAFLNELGPQAKGEPHETFSERMRRHCVVRDAWQALHPEIPRQAGWMQGTYEERARAIVDDHMNSVCESSMEDAIIEALYFARHEAIASCSPAESIPNSNSTQASAVSESKEEINGH